MMSIVPSMPQNLHLGSMLTLGGWLVGIQKTSPLPVSYLQGGTPTRTTV